MTKYIQKEGGGPRVGECTFNKNTYQQALTIYFQVYKPRFHKSTKLILSSHVSMN